MHGITGITQKIYQGHPQAQGLRPTNRPGKHHVCKFPPLGAAKMLKDFGLAVRMGKTKIRITKWTVANYVASKSTVSLLGGSFWESIFVLKHSQMSVVCLSFFFCVGCECLWMLEIIHERRLGWLKILWSNGTPSRWSLVVLPEYECIPGI